MAENKINKLREEAERLQVRSEELLRLAKQKKSQATAIERKERTHRLIQHGGLVEMILGSSFDKGMLVGILDGYKDAFMPENDRNYIEIKSKGDKIIAEIEDENKKKRQKKENQTNEQAE